MNSGYYDANQLYVSITKDENWTVTQAHPQAGTVEEYTDKQGRVVLKRAFNEKDNALEMLSTYYVYDDFGNLSFVLPPGNITSLNRSPMGVNTYSYSGNRLASISGAIDGSYTYDANGNQTADSHKGIILAYNYLSLPETISKASTSETMTNTWLATGVKIRKWLQG